MKWSDIMPEPAMQKGDSLALKADELRRQGIEIFPPQNQIFRALTLTPPDKLKACIIGQDPYHTPGAANGLAFSINNGRPVQPSLQNIFKELCDDIRCPRPTTSDLTPWAEQGVLLLNSSLTVQAHQANSHADWGWDVFTHAVIQTAVDLPQPVVFIIWGSKAKAMMDGIIMPDNKRILFSTHPSPFSAYSGRTPFFGSRPFSKTNEILQSFGVSPINWQLP